MSIELDPNAGADLGSYRIERVIGRGGMGVVYLAEQRSPKRRVALKVLTPELAGDASFRERFEREWQLAASIEHPNIVPIYEAGEVDGHLFIAMRYVEGTDLKSLITQRGRLDPEEALAVVGPVADALHAAHRRGLIHRDVKPANIMVSSGDDDPGGVEHVYLTDFGIAKHAASRAGLTRTGFFVGTLDYAAPEQIEGKTLDGRSDQYALACVLYQCLTGVLPFDKESDAAMLYAHLVEQPPSISTACPDLPEQLDPVLKRGLAKTPDERYPSIRELVTGARAAIAEQPTKRAEPVAPTALAAAAAAATVDVAPTVDGAPTVEPAIDVAPTVEPTVAAPDRPAPAAPTVPAPGPVPETELAASAAPGTISAAPETAAPAMPERETPEAPARAEDLAPPAGPPPPRPAPSRSRRKPLAWALAALLVVGVAAGAVIALTAGGSPSSAPATAPAQTTEAPATVASTPATNAAETAGATETAPAEVVPAFVLPPEERAALASGGASLFVTDPGGRIVQLDSGSLEPGAMLLDGASPRAVASAGDAIVVSDDRTVTRLEADGLAPIAAFKFGAGAMLGGGDGQPVVAVRPVGGSEGRLCVVGDGGLDPCVDLGFSPGGVGVTGGSAFVTDPEGGSVHPFEIKPAKLVPGEPIPVDGGLSGAPVGFRDQLYVPVEDGVAALALSGGAPGASIPLGGRPEAIWIVPFNGRLFATLPGTDEVAVVDTSFPDNEPVRVTVAGRPSALAGSLESSGEDSVFVANVADGTITRLDALTGEALGSSPVSGLGATPVTPAVVSDVAFAADGDVHRVTIKLGEGQIQGLGIVATDSEIADGTATVELWQGGISTAVEGSEQNGVAISIKPRPGRLLVTATAAPGAFVTFDVRRGEGGHSVVLELTEAPPAPVESPSSGSSSSGSSSSGGSPPESPPAPAPEPGITVG